MQKNIAVTGANGFIGKALCKALYSRGHFVRAIVRDLSASTVIENIEMVEVGSINHDTDWSLALKNINYVIHCAALTNFRHNNDEVILKEYHEVNVEGTRRLAEQAFNAGVQRFLQISSIKVNGEITDGLQSFSHDDDPSPEGPYGVSKLEAEQAIQEVAALTGLEVVIIRPPLVYGPGVKGNFISLLDLINIGIPLPLGSIKNKRSFVGIENLIDLIIISLYHPNAKNQLFLVSDDEDLSTTDLLRRLAKVSGKPDRLIPFPVFLLKLSSRLIGKKEISQRLIGNLQIDITKTKDILNWSPPVSIEKGLKKTDAWYFRNQ